MTVYTRRLTALPLVALAIAAVCLPACAPSPGSSDALVSGLVEGFGARPFEIRLSGGFEHTDCDRAPSDSVRCTPLPPAGTPAFESLARLSARIRGQAHEFLHAQALWHLLWHDTGATLDKAIATLRLALERAPRSGPLWNDLAAAYYIRAVVERTPYDFVRALSAVETALEHELLDEAVFNRALILEKLHLRRQAIESWRDYASWASRSSWASDARRRLARLSARTTAERWESKRELLLTPEQPSTDGLRGLVMLSPQLTRQWAMSHLLANWAEAHLARRGSDEVAWRELGIRLGRELKSVTGDRTLADSTSLLKSCCPEHRSDDQIAQALLDFTTGQRLFYDLRIDDAKSLLEKARVPLAKAGSVLAHWASLSLAGVSYYQGDYAAAAAVFSQLAASAELDHYWALAGRSAWGLGLARARQQRRTESLNHYQNALRWFTRARERENLATVHALVADQLSLLGQYEDAWKHRHSSLRNLVEFRESRRLQSLLNTASEAHDVRGYPRAALALQNESVALSEVSSNPQEIVEARARRARLLHRLGRAEEARRDLAAADRGLAGVSDPTMRLRLEASLNVVKGHLETKPAPERALGFFTKAAAAFEKTSYTHGLVECHLGRASAYAELDRVHAAEHELRRALGFFDEQRRLLHELESRESFLLSATGVFDQLISWSLMQGEIARGLHYADLSRDVGPGAASSWPNDVHDSGARFVGELQRRMDSSTWIIEYAVLGDELLTWIVGRDSLRFSRNELDTARLRREIESVLDEAMGTVSRTTASARLYDRLIPRELRNAPETDRFYFVPSGLLNGVPFAALVNPDTNEYLVEERTTAVLPAASHILRRAHDASGADGRQKATALIVAEPARDKHAYPWLGELPGASAELQIVRAVYPEAEVLSGSAATKSAFATALTGKTIVHYAGHAVFNEAAPSHSYLVLAADADGESAVFAHELADVPAPPKLVVLSSCHTVATVDTRTGALVGLARPFLLGGTGDVVGSLWELQDVAAPSFFRVFYESYRSSGSAATALRDAQLSLLRSSTYRSPSYWAGYVVLSSHV